MTIEPPDEDTVVVDRRSAVTVGVLSLAGLSRIAAAVVRPTWHDEHFTAWAARLPMTDLLGALRLDSGPPLPYMLVKLFAAIGLAPITGARLVSVAAGTMAVLLVMRAARTACGERAALICGGLIALHPLAVSFSSEGRAYGLLLLAGAWAWERIETLRSGGRGAVGLAAAVALACWSHGLGPAVGVAAAVAAVAIPSAARARSMAAAAAGMASFLPWLPVAVAQPPAATAWMHDAWSSLPAVERLVAPVRLLPPVAPFGRTVDLPGFSDLAVLAAAVGLLALVVSSRPPATTVAMAAVPALGLPILAALGVPAFYPGRAEALFLAPALAIAACGATRTRARAFLASVLVGAAAVASATAILRWRATPPPHEQLIAAAIAARHPDGGVVATSGYWWLDVSAALERPGVSRTVLAFPACVARHPGWFDPLSCTVAADEASVLLARLAAPDGRPAIVITPGLPSEPALQAIAARLSLQPALTVPGGVLYLPAGEPQ